jgi:hypothetical protein
VHQTWGSVRTNSWVQNDNGYKLLEKEWKYTSFSHNISSILCSCDFPILGKTCKIILHEVIYLHCLDHSIETQMFMYVCKVLSKYGKCIDVPRYTVKCHYSKLWGT